MTEGANAPENTAARVALWRALHLHVDGLPHVFEDAIGLALVNPAADWQQRPDMSEFTRPFRASVLARARYVEDALEESISRGTQQYVILGAGLDTFAQRKRELARRLRGIFEVDQPGPQTWKRQRLDELGYGVAPPLRLVPVDFEHGQAWLPQLIAAGFDPQQPSLVASTGVSMYLTTEAIASTLREVAALGPGSTLIMSFMLPIELVDPTLRPGLEAAARGAREHGTPFISFFTPEHMLELAREAGFRAPQHVSANALAQRYFADRSDGLRPPDNSEELLVATT